MSLRYSRFLLPLLLVQAASAASVPTAAQSDDNLIDSAITAPTVYNFYGKVCHFRFSAIGSSGMGSYTTALGVYGITGQSSAAGPLAHHVMTPYDANANFGIGISDHTAAARIALAARAICTDGKYKYADRTNDLGTNWHPVNAATRQLSPNSLIVCPGLTTQPPVLHTLWMGAAEDKCGHPQSDYRDFQLNVKALTKNDTVSAPGENFDFNNRGICNVELAGTNVFWVDYAAGWTAYTYSVNDKNVSPSNLHRISIPYQAGQVLTVAMTASPTKAIALSASVTCSIGGKVWSDVTGQTGSKWTWSFVSDKTFNEVPRGPVAPCGSDIKCNGQTCPASPVSNGAAWIGGTDGATKCPIINRTDRTHVFRLAMPTNL